MISPTPLFFLFYFISYNGDMINLFSIFNLSQNQPLPLYACMCSLANVDPIDVARNITGLNPETTLGTQVF